ncbi:MAG: SDR family NAD(P)-dependent oxidoreductase [Burkholderiales bacterium]
MTTSSLPFAGRVAIVTGAGSGIGRDTAALLASQGAIVGINDARAQAAQETVELIQGAGGQAFAIPGDASSPVDVARNIDAALQAHGHIDVLVNNAGVIDYGPPEDITPERWQHVMNVNVNGVFLWSQGVAVRSMIPSRRGAIVNISSAAGLAGIPNNLAYVTSKHAVVGLTKALSVDWARHGIRVNCVCPGLTETAMVRETAAKNPAMWADRRRRVPMGRAAAPSEQAAAIVFLASDAASYIQGLIMNVDGGQMALFSGYSMPQDTPAVTAGS